MIPMNSENNEKSNEEKFLDFLDFPGNTRHFDFNEFRRFSQKFTEYYNKLFGPYYEDETNAIYDYYDMNTIFYDKNWNFRISVSTFGMAEKDKNEYTKVYSMEKSM